MAKKGRYIAAVALVLCVCALLAACSNKGNSFKMQDGMYVDTKTNVSYYDAPACYEPIEIGTELYGTLGEAKLYKMPGADPKQWLCDASGTVFYAEGVVLPAVDGLNTSTMTLVYEKDSKEFAAAAVTDGAVISLVAKTYTEGQSIEKPYWTASMYDVNWRIRFIDETRGICYVLAYFELTEDYIGTDDSGAEVNYGRKFIYNRFEDKMVAAGDVLDVYVAAYKDSISED